MTFDQHLAAAQDTFRRWLAAVPKGGRVVVFCHFDADGLGAGAVFGRALPRLGLEDVTVVSSGRHESAFSDEARGRLAALEPDALLVTDLGVHETGTLEARVPVLYVDHHRPSGEPPGAFVVSGYGWDPIPCSAWLARDLVAGAASGADLSDLDWIAAVGVISDLGEKAPWPPLAAVKKRVTAKWLKETVALVNAARRAPTFDAETALDALMTYDDPKTLATAEGPAADRLRAARQAVKDETAEARKAAPVFSQRDAAVPAGVAPDGLRFAPGPGRLAGPGPPAHRPAVAGAAAQVPRHLRQHGLRRRRRRLLDAGREPGGPAAGDLPGHRHAGGGTGGGATATTRRRAATSRPTCSTACSTRSGSAPRPTSTHGAASGRRRRAAWPGARRARAGR